MPLFMDVHNLGGVSMDDVAKAHQPDLATQGEYDVSYLRYWMDEGKGQIFCMVEAPGGGCRLPGAGDIAWFCSRSGGEILDHAGKIASVLRPYPMPDDDEDHAKPRLSAHTHPGPEAPARR